jgi:hypothetical protein
MELSQIKKTIINVATLVVAVGTPVLAYTTNLLPENVALVISAVVAGCGALVHYFAPNETSDPVVAETQSVRLKKAPRKATRARKRPVTPKPA